MQKEYVDKLIDRICIDTENLFSCSPKASNAKCIPNFILLLELVSLNSENEERINRILHSYYFSQYLKEIRTELSREAWRRLFKGKTIGQLHDICERALIEMGIDTNSFWPTTLYTFINGGPGANGVKITDEFKIRFCNYLRLDVATYLPSKGSYKDYLLQRQKELMRLLDMEPEINPDHKYQGMSGDMKDALFNKFSSFIEKTCNDAWEGKIDKNKLCSETQSLTTDLIEYRKVANNLY